MSCTVLVATLCSSTFHSDDLITCKTVTHVIIGRPAVRSSTNLFHTAPLKFPPLFRNDHHDA